MPDLEFNLDSSFHENLEAFKRHVSAIDPALAEILFRHIDKLQATDDQVRDRASRAAFNRAVLADLEASVLTPDDLAGLL
jgi:hypothetical protein